MRKKPAAEAMVVMATVAVYAAQLNHGDTSRDIGRAKIGRSPQTARSVERVAALPA